MYKCGKCGKGVVVVKDTPPIKQCDCKAPVVCDMEATAEGTSNLKQK